MTIPVIPALERRQEIQAHAAAIGIDDAYIDELVESFYARVRRDAVLGPIFDEAIADAWPTHLALMKDFWASVAFNAGRYSGKPVPAHQKLVRIEPGHFGRWLDLFGKTLEDTAPTAAAVDYFMERAARIAESLRLAMFGSAATAARR